MVTSWKFSQASIAALVTAAHVLLVYLLFSLGSTRDKTESASVEPMPVSLIGQPRPPIRMPEVTFKPRLVKFQITAPQLTPNFQIDVPPEPTPSAMQNPPVAGTPGPLAGPARPVGGPFTLTITHYVAPVFPHLAIFLGEHGDIAMALLVGPQGNVDQVKILHSTGSRRLDRAAVSAVRQWKFASDMSRARAEPVWGRVKLRFALPQRLLGVPLIVMPYAAVARQINAEIAKNRALRLRAPSTEVSVRRLLQKLIAAFPGEPGHDPGTDRESSGDSLEAELGRLGTIQSMKFLGFANHGIDRDKSESSELRYLLRDETSHWQVYDVEQNRGSSVWLVAVASSGSIQRIEVAMR